MLLHSERPSGSKATQCRQSLLPKKPFFISKIWQSKENVKAHPTPATSPQSVSIYKNVLEPLLVSESPDLPNLPDPPAPIQKPVVQVEVIHLVHENKPATGKRGLRRKQGPEQSSSACLTQNVDRALDLKPSFHSANMY